MANHMGIHHYEALISAPPAALAAGALMEYLRNGPSLRVLQWVPVAVLLALAAREAATILLLRESQHDTPLIAFALMSARQPNLMPSSCCPTATWSSFSIAAGTRSAGS